MSRSWREYVAALCPTRVALIRRGGAPGGALVGERDCAGGGTPTWDAAVLALGELLAQAGARRSKLGVVLSSHFARYCLLPWSGEIGSREELEAYARIRFEELYGTAAGAWTLCIAPAPAGHARLAAAIETDLLARLHEVASAVGARLDSVQPYLTAAFNQLRRRLRDDEFLFVVSESGRSSVLAARGGRWISVRSTAGIEGDSALAALIERESEMLGFEAGAMPRLYLHEPGRASGAPGAVRGVVPVTLDVAGMAGLPATSPVRVMAQVGAR